MKLETQHTKARGMEVLSTMMGILSGCICISNHHILPFKYITFIFVNDMSIKLKKNKSIVKRVRRWRKKAKIRADKGNVPICMVCY